jgi:membrane-associated protease RseP (regulator of RpoE activity)
MFYLLGDVGFFSAASVVLAKPSLMLQGLPFSIPLMVILLAHEMGHFLACRYYGIRCTPPFFIPAPISIAGTLGAFIKIKSPFQHKRALFDVGIAGPLAGFVFVMPALWIGLSLSRIIPKGSIAGGLSFGEPLIFRLFGRFILNYSPANQDMLAHPIAMAAWFGLLATSLNLLPIWQLDGGHIAYAILGRSTHKKISVIAVVSLIFVSFLGWPTPSYLLFGILLLILGARVHFFHPAAFLDEEELGPGRVFLGLLAAMILIISFIPVPISIA